MRIRLLLAVGALLSASLAAHADITSLFNASGSFDDGSTLSGTVTIDTTTGAITAEDLIVSAPFSATFVNDIYGIEGDGAEFVFDSEDSGDNYLDISLPVGSLVGYTGSEINNFSDANNPNSGAVTYLTSGALTLAPASVTPEPSSFILLGTGLLGVVGAMRKRFA